MKKAIRMIVLTALVLTLALGCVSSALAGVLPPYGPGQAGYTSVVLCDTLNVRSERSSGSNSLKTLHYGDRFIVMSVVDGWAEVLLSDDVDASPAGWVNAEYIAIDPAWYRTDERTRVYAWNDLSAPKVALLEAAETLPILKDEGGWLIVSLRGGVGFIKK